MDSKQFYLAYISQKASFIIIIHNSWHFNKIKLQNTKKKKVQLFEKTAKKFNVLGCNNQKHNILDYSAIYVKVYGLF